MNGNTQPESTAKVEKIALRIAMEMFGEDWPNAVGKLEEMLRPYIPSQPPQISNNGTCSCCGTKLVRQELTLPHYVDWCSNCQTWAGAQPTPKVEEK